MWLCRSIFVAAILFKSYKVKVFWLTYDVQYCVVQEGHGVAFLREVLTLIIIFQIFLESSV